MKKFITIVLALLMLASMASADDKKKNSLYEKKGDKERIYNADYDAVWSACIGSAKENFALDTVDKENGLMTFQTGISMTSNGFRVGVALIRESDGRTRVKLNTQKKFQLVAWGAGGRIADKFFKGLDMQLTEMKKPQQ